MHRKQMFLKVTEGFYKNKEIPTRGSGEKGGNREVRYSKVSYAGTAPFGTAK